MIDRIITLLGRYEALKEQLTDPRRAAGAYHEYFELQSELIQMIPNLVAEVRKWQQITREERAKQIHFPIWQNLQGCQLAGCPDCASRAWEGCPHQAWFRDQAAQELEIESSEHFSVATKMIKMTPERQAAIEYTISTFEQIDTEIEDLTAIRILSDMLGGNKMESEFQDVETMVLSGKMIELTSDRVRVFQDLLSLIEEMREGNKVDAEEEKLVVWRRALHEMLEETK